MVLVQHLIVLPAQQEAAGAIGCVCGNYVQWHIRDSAAGLKFILILIVSAFGFKAFVAWEPGAIHAGRVECKLPRSGRSQPDTSILEEWAV